MVGDVDVAGQMDPPARTDVHDDEASTRKIIKMVQAKSNFSHPFSDRAAGAFHVHKGRKACAFALVDELGR